MERSNFLNNSIYSYLNNETARRMQQQMRGDLSEPEPPGTRAFSQLKELTKESASGYLLERCNLHAHRWVVHIVLRRSELGCRILRSKKHYQVFVALERKNHMIPVLAQWLRMNKHFLFNDYCVLPDRFCRKQGSCKAKRFVKCRLCSA
jgi:hypothetical protein